MKSGSTGPTEVAAQPLLEPFHLNDLVLANRVVMAPMTRSRASTAELAPTALHVQYYQQRAGAGLIISEGTWISAEAIGSMNVPGIFSDQQVKAWAEVTDAVHRAGGRIFVQIAHTGAYSHPSYLGGHVPAGPSAISVGGQVFSRGGFVATPVPRALTGREICDIVADYRAAAQNARRSGFDGIEIHAQRWYLIAQFLNPVLNVRTDSYGGSLQNRARFLFEVLDAVTEGFGLGPGRIGIKLAPFMPALDGSDVRDLMWPIYEYVVRRLLDYPLAYLHLMAPQSTPEHTGSNAERAAAIRQVREMYPRTLMVNGEFDQSGGNTVIADGSADLVSYAQSFIANPDLPARFARGIALAVGDRATYYQGDAHGYVDYPAAEDSDPTTSAQEVAS